LSLLPDAAVGQWLADNAPLVHGVLLDNGCGNKPYESWYGPMVKRSVGIDAASGSHVEVYGLVDALPFADTTFDTVLCTEVLEHAEDAECAVKEIFRVLMPGGHALVTVPFLYPVHEAPHDYTRFTHYGLRNLLERQGLEVLSVEAKGGAGLFLAHSLVLALLYALDRIDMLLHLRRPLSKGRLIRALLAGPQELRLRKGRIRRDVRGSAARVSLGYMAVARRPV
jgi:SAM-dependent methyltransferase